MLDHSIVPVLAALVTQDNVVSRHRCLGILFLEDVAFLGTFAESGFCEVDMVDIGTLSGLRRRVLCGRDTCQQGQDEKERANAFHSFLQSCCDLI